MRHNQKGTTSEPSGRTGGVPDSGGLLGRTSSPDLPKNRLTLHNSVFTSLAEASAPRVQLESHY